MTTITEAPTVPAVMNRAAEIIEERGHCRGGLVGADGSVCTIQALRLAEADLSGTADPVGRGPAAKGADARISTMTGEGNACIWNNRTGQTAKTIAAGLREMAEA